MAHTEGLNRRAFLRNAGLTALAGTVGSATPLGAAAAAAAPGDEPASGRYDFDTVYNRFGTDSTKWDAQVRAFGEGSIAVGMGIADMDFRAAPCITRALNQRLQHENWGYLTMPRDFTEGIVRWNKQRYGIDVNPDNLVVTNGVHPALIAALRTFSPRGSKVLVQTPTYNGFYGDIRAAGCVAEESPMKLVNGRYEMDFEDLERRISHDTNTLILCNPQNPTGNTWSKQDLLKLGEICTRRRVIVLSDEIHCDFVNKGEKYTPYASLPDRDIVMNSITFKAASKSFCLAAMKVGWFFSDNADYVARVRPNNRTDLATLSMIANRAAYAEGENWLNQVVEYIDGNHAFVESFVRANIPLIKVRKPQGTYLSWLDVTGVVDKINAKKQAEDATRETGRPVTPETIVERFFVKNAKVHMNQGASYGKGGENHMRMNIGTSRKLVELALTNIAEALRRA